MHSCALCVSSSWLSTRLSQALCRDAADGKAPIRAPSTAQPPLPERWNTLVSALCITTYALFVSLFLLSSSSSGAHAAVWHLLTPCLLV